MPYDFTAEEIARLLRLLETELKLRGVSASIYVVGGAAIALEHDDGRRTADVDVWAVPEEQVLDAARSVADAEGIPPTWLNKSAAAWLPPERSDAMRSSRGAGLAITVAVAETLLAMKLVASRNRDIADIKLLAEELELTDARAMADLVREQYGLDQLEHVHGGYVDMLRWCERLVTRFWAT